MSLTDDRLRRVTRLFIIATQLQSGARVTRADLAAACNCDRRTVTRDLSYLEEAGFAIRYDPLCRSYVLENPGDLLTVPFTLGEILALALAQDAMLAQAGTPFEAPLRIAFDRVSALVPCKLRQAMVSVHQAVAFDTATRRDYSAAPWQALMDAIRHRRTIEADYYSLSRDAVSTRQIDPYHLVLRQGFWNLVGRCHTRREVLLFALDGFRAIRPACETFVVPADFSLAEYLRGSVGVLRGKPTEIAVRFEAKVARWARRRRWSFPCALSEEPDGGLALRGTVAGLEEIAMELLRWGAGVTALEPPELRAKLREEAQAIAAKYADDPASK
jgi:predicted DNA-binding transcriptional regulator YafY